MLTVLSVLGVLVVLFVAAAVATREGTILVDAPGDVADVDLPGGQLQPEDLHAVRFGLAVRGYRMSEVDAVLERAAHEIADRDARILELENAGAPAGGMADEMEEPTVAIEPAEPAAPIVPTEPPLDSPPPPPEPAEPDPEPPDREPEAELIEPEPPEPTEPTEPAEPTEPSDPDPTEPDPVPTEPETIEPDPESDAAGADDEQSASDEPDSAASEASPALDPSATDDPGVDVESVDDEPPPAPPVEVAVVRTEVAPLPSAVSVDLPSTGKDPDADAH